MAHRVKDLWFTTGARGEKRKTKRHPDNGGNPKAKRWLAVWADPSGRERTEAFAVKKRAEDYAAEQDSDVRRGEYLDPDAQKARLDPVARKWLRLREVGASSAGRYESCYRLHVKPVFGERLIASIRPSEVAEWSLGLAAQPVTRYMALMILTGVLDLAAADKVRRDNPARDLVVSRPKSSRSRAREREAWDTARVLAVARACGVNQAVPLVAAGLGLREGELFGLADDDIDGDAGMVHVRRQVARVDGRYVLKLPKGGKTRDVPLPLGVGALINLNVRGADNEKDLVTLPWLGEDNTEAKRPVSARLLFRYHDGPWQAWAWHRYVWMPALATAGVIPAYTGRDYPEARDHGMHALRHWYSSCIQDAGVSLAGVMEFMGHSRKSAPLSVGVYGHVTDAARSAARRAVDTSLFSLRPVEPDGTITELRLAR